MTTTRNYIIVFYRKNLDFCGTVAIFDYMARALLIANPENATIEELKLATKVNLFVVNYPQPDRKRKKISKFRY